MAVFNDRFNEYLNTNKVNLSALADYCGISKLIFQTGGKAIMCHLSKF